MASEMNNVIRAALLLALLCGPAVSHASETDEKDIKAVIESFRTAIIQRDKPRFLTLFVSPDVPWQGVLTDEGLVQLRHFDAHAAKVAYDSRSTPGTFLDSIIRSKKSSEEKFSNIKVDTDGEVATASADYEFLSGEKLVNSGRECWLLVRTGAGWKITTLAFSSTLNKDEDKH
jgi:hypothetical protein